MARTAPLKKASEVIMSAESKSDSALKLEPNLSSADFMINLLTGEQQGKVTFQVFPDSKGSPGFPWHGDGTLKEFAPRLIKAQRAGCGIFICINETDGKGRRRENITAARANFIDLDGTSLPRGWAIEPHLITESSRGRFHAYWLVNDWLSDLNLWSENQARLASYYGGDPSVIDPPRVMRLAGFWHLKGEAFRSRIIGGISVG
jgi:RepB DNA-primase from phage plasmid